MKRPSVYPDWSLVYGLPIQLATRLSRKNLAFLRVFTTKATFRFIQPGGSSGLDNVLKL